MTTKKIRVIGSDYYPVAKAKVSVDGGDFIVLEKLDGVLYAGVKEFLTGFKTSLIQYYGGELYFGGNVGVVRKKNFKDEYDITLQIKSRFDGEKDDKKAYFLAAMLLSEDDLENKFKNERVEISYDDIFEVLLLYLFQTQLESASAKGIYRKYVRFENNDSRPHGVIDIPRHIRENVIISGGKMRNNGKIAYSYRELTANNSMNRLILAAYDKLRSKFPTLTETRIGSRHESFIKTLRTEIGFSNTNTRSIVSENLDPIAHPYYHEYEELRKTCLKILRGDGVSIFDAECSDDVESLLIYVPTLWEHYLEKSIAPLPMEFGFDTKGGTREDGKKGKEYCLKYLIKTAEPDLVFYRDKTNKNPISILDAKFKPFWGEIFKHGKKDERADSDLDKCIRDMVVFKAQRTGVVFPFKGKTEDSVKSDDIIDELKFDMVGVPVPEIEDKSFPDWHGEFAKSTDKALNEYIELLRDMSKKSEQTT